MYSHLCSDGILLSCLLGEVQRGLTLLAAGRGLGLVFIDVRDLYSFVVDVEYCAVKATLEAAGSSASGSSSGVEKGKYAERQYQKRGAKQH
jgi:hypothetical protein